jgi:hypothetical protein
MLNVDTLENVGILATTNLLNDLIVLLIAESVMVDPQVILCSRSPPL